LFFELDPKTFENTLILWLLQDFEAYVATAFKFNNKNISEEKIKDRLEICFGTKLLGFIINSAERISDYETDDDETGIGNYVSYLFQEELSKFGLNSLTHYDVEYKKSVVFSFEEKDNKQTILRFLSDKMPALATRHARYC